MIDVERHLETHIPLPRDPAERTNKDEDKSDNRTHRGGETSREPRGDQTAEGSRGKSPDTIELPSLGSSKYSLSKANERYHLIARTMDAPSLPSGESIADNVNHPPGLIEWVNAVREKGRWDYKRKNLALYETAGNFNYMVTGLEQGIPEQILRRAAGLVQILTGTWKPEYGLPTDLKGTFGDQLKDQVAMTKGVKYYDDKQYIRDFIDYGEGFSKALSEAERVYFEIGLIEEDDIEIPPSRRLP